MLFDVVYNVRRVGAIGRFYPHAIQVDVPDSSYASCDARAQLEASGFEVLTPVKVVPVEAQESPWPDDVVFNSTPVTPRLPESK